MSFHPTFRHWKQLPLLHRWAIIFLSVLLIYTLFGFILLPKIIRSQLEEKLSISLNRLTSVKQVKINPFTLEATIIGFQVLDRQGTAPFVSFEKLYANLHIASLFKRALVIQNCSFDGPSFTFTRNEDLTYNFSDLLQTESKIEPHEEKQAGRPFIFSVNNIEITGGAIKFNDLPKNASHSVSDMRLAVPFISNFPYDIETFVNPAFSATINGTPLALKGGSRPFTQSKESEFHINFSGINLTDYVTYLPEDLNFAISKAHLDIDLAVSFLENANEKPFMNIWGTMALNDVALVDSANEKILSLPELSIDIKSSDIFRKQLHLTKLSLRQPEITATKNTEGKFNLSDLTMGSKKEPASPQEKAAPVEDLFLLTLDSLIVDSGTLFFSDQSIASPFQTTMQSINVQVNTISTAADSRADYVLNLVTESDEHLSLQGTFSISPLQVDGNIEVNNAQIDKYRPYYINSLPGPLKAEKMNCSVSFDYGAEKAEINFTNAGLDIEALNLQSPDTAETINIAAFSVSDGTVNLGDMSIRIGQCATSGGTIPLTRRKDGTLNLQQFLASGKTKPEEPAVEGNSTSENEKSWELTVNNLKLTDYSIEVTDLVPDEPFHANLDQIHLSVENITTKKGEEGIYNLAMRVNERGSIDINGPTTLSPFETTLDLKLKNIPLIMGQPYIGQQLNIICKEGKINVTGSLKAEIDEHGQPAAHFQADISIPDFSSLDSQLTQNLLSWQNLSVTDLSISTPPLQISTGEIALDAAHVNSVVYADGKINLASLVKEKADDKIEETPENKTKKPEEIPDIKIGTISLANSKLDFRDESISPTFTSSLDKFNGTISGLTSAKDRHGDINLKGVLDQNSPIQITGRIQPWQDFFTDVAIEFRDIDLSPMSPYSMKFIGYPLNKGKLTLNLHYLIDGKKLDSKNEAYINQITLGDFVKNETATNLPVKLAISLLKNRAGEIHLNVPVSGELDDPDFSVAGVIFKIIGNLILKAATSPFALLGALIPDFEELQYVEFNPGQDSIIADNIESLTSLAKVLYDRPGITIELTGHVATQEDSENMLARRFTETLKAEKIKEMTKKGMALPDNEAIDISEDYEDYLLKAYKSAPFDKPENFLGFLKKQPKEEMERMLYEHLAVTENDLRLLAVSRANAVKTFLVENGPVESERIFLIEPKLSEAPRQDMPAMRVDLLLK